MFFGSYDYGVCYASNIIDYEEALNRQINSKGQLRQKVFKRALEGINAEYKKQQNADHNNQEIVDKNQEMADCKIKECQVNLKRLNSTEIKEGCKQSKIDEHPERAQSSSPTFAQPSAVYSKPRAAHQKAKSSQQQKPKVSTPKPKVAKPKVHPEAFASVKEHLKPLKVHNPNIQTISYEQWIEQEAAKKKNIPLPVVMNKADCPQYDLELPPTQLATFDTIAEWKECVYELLEKTNDPVQKYFMEGTYDMVELAIHLDHALFSSDRDLGYAMQLLTDLKHLVWKRVDTDKLQQIPEAVDTIRKLCNFTDVPVEFEDEDVFYFIRKLSGQVYGYIMVRLLLSLTLNTNLKCFEYFRKASQTCRRMIPSLSGTHLSSDAPRSRKSLMNQKLPLRSWSPLSRTRMASPVTRISSPGSWKSSPAVRLPSTTRKSSEATMKLKGSPIAQHDFK